MRIARLCACLVATTSIAASAQWLGNDYAVYGAPQSTYAASSFMNQTYFNVNAMKRAKATGGALAAATTAPQGGQPRSTAHELAARFPAAQRAQIEKAFVESFAAYQKIESQFNIPRNDLAGAVAAFIAGNYMAYRNAGFPDQHFPPLVRQVRQVLASNPAFTSASASDKRHIYEQLAMVGTFMATTNEALKRNPNPQAEGNFRQSAKANLEQFLKTDANLIEITGDGLVIR